MNEAIIDKSPLIIGLITATIVLFFVLRFFTCRLKEARLSRKISQYVYIVHDMKDLLEQVSEALRVLSNHGDLADSERDKLRVILWRMNTMNGNIQQLTSIEGSKSFQKQIRQEDLSDENPFVRDNIQPDTEDARFMEKVFAIIHNHYEASSFNVDQLGSLMGMSRSSLYNRIKACSGQAPASIIRQYRMEQAKDLLMQKKYTISEIAFKIGYTDVKHFRQIFLKTYGKSPTKLLKEE